MSPSWNTAFTVVRHVLICTLLAVSIGTVVYMGKTFTKKLEPAINNINSSFTFVKDAVEQTVGTEEQRRKIQDNLQKSTENIKNISTSLDNYMGNPNDKLTADQQKQCGEDFREAVRSIKELAGRLERGEGGWIARALFGIGKSGE